MTAPRPLRASEVVAPTLLAAAQTTRVALLRLSASPDDETGVHDLRVGIRRMRTVLRAGGDLYRRRPMRRIAKALRAVAHATNALRDEEVLAETLALARLAPGARRSADAWLRRRVPVMVELRRLGLEALASSRLDEVLDALAHELALPPRRDRDAESWAAELILAERIRTVCLLPEVSDAEADAEALHQLRIQWKRLRYTAEMLGGAMGDRVPSLPNAQRFLELARFAAAFQKELGVLHDVDVARETVAHATDLTERARANLTAPLLVLRVRLAREAVTRLVAELPAIVMPDALVPGAR